MSRSNFAASAKVASTWRSGSEGHTRRLTFPPTTSAPQDSAASMNGAAPASSVPGVSNQPSWGKAITCTSTRPAMACAAARTPSTARSSAKGSASQLVRTLVVP